MMSGYAKNWLTLEEWKRLKDAPIQKDYKKNEDRLKWRDELLLVVSYKGALRISETLDLQYPYDFTKEHSNSYVTLTGTKKRGENEEVLAPIGRGTFRDIDKYMTAFHGDKETNYLFEITRQRAYDIINEMAEVAEIDKKLGTHTLRRSRAKHLLDSGWDIEDVSELLRHKDIASTKEYLKISKKAIGDKMASTDEELGL